MIIFLSLRQMPESSGVDMLLDPGLRRDDVS